MKKVYSLTMTEKMLKAVGKKEDKKEDSKVIDLFADWLCYIAENVDKVTFE